MNLLDSKFYQVTKIKILESLKLILILLKINISLPIFNENKF